MNDKMKTAIVEKLEEIEQLKLASTTAQTHIYVADAFQKTNEVLEILVQIISSYEKERRFLQIQAITGWTLFAITITLTILKWR